MGDQIAGYKGRTKGIKVSIASEACVPRKSRRGSEGMRFFQSQAFVSCLLG